MFPDRKHKIFVNKNDRMHRTKAYLIFPGSSALVFNPSDSKFFLTELAILTLLLALVNSSQFKLLKRKLSKMEDMSILRRL